MGSDTLEIGYIENPLHWQGWPNARAMLDEAVRRSDDTWDYVEDELAADRMRLVVIQPKGGDPVAAGVVRSALTPRGEMLEISLAGGSDHRAWADFGLRALYEGAKQSGMAGVRLLGRPGWQKVFPEMRVSYVALEMAA